VTDSLLYLPVDWTESGVGAGSGSPARHGRCIREPQSQMSSVTTWQTRRSRNDSDAPCCCAQPTSHHHDSRATRTRRQHPQNQLSVRCWCV